MIIEIIERMGELSRVERIKAFNIQDELSLWESGRIFTMGIKGRGDCVSVSSNVKLKKPGVPLRMVLRSFRVDTTELLRSRTFLFLLIAGAVRNCFQSWIKNHPKQMELDTALHGVWRYHQKGTVSSVTVIHLGSYDAAQISHYPCTELSVTAIN